MAVNVSSTNILHQSSTHSPPFRLSPCSQQQSSLQVCFPVPTFQHTALHAQWQAYIPGLGVQGCGMDHLCRSHSILCTTDILFHSPLTAADAPLLSQLMSPSFEGISPDVGNFLSFQYPQGCRSHPISSSLPTAPPLLSFILPSSSGISSVLSGVQDLLKMISHCSVRIVSSVAVSLMHLWRKMNSMSSFLSGKLNSLV